jgi:hypothetical protein
MVAFYHKGRKKFVPWLALELARKMNRDPDLVVNDLKGLAQDGLAKSNRIMRGNTTFSTWELTKAGQDEALQIIRAEEMVRAR